MSLVLSLLLGLCLSAHARETGENQSSTIEGLMNQACEGMLTGPDLEKARQKWAGKVVIFDTNVLLNDPYAVYKYPGATIVIPGTVLEEIDGKKEDLQTGKAAREFSRIIDEYLKEGTNLRKGVEIMEGTILKVDNRDMTRFLSETTLDRGKKDNEIVALALAYTYEVSGNGNVILVSDDRNVRIKASSEEVVSIPFEYEWVTSAKKIENAYNELIVSHDELRQFQSSGVLKKPEDFKIAPNEFVMIRTENMPGCPECLARFVYDREAPENSVLRRVPDFNELASPPKNLEQAMLLDLLFDKNVHMVMVEADAGTGKTYMTMEAALYQKVGAPGNRANRYQDVTITKPMVTMGKGDLGALPGGSSEKLKEKLNSFYDNLRVLGHKMKNLEGKPGSSSPVKVDNLEIAPFPEVRGRSFHDTFFVIDEFQNTSIHEAKTIITRAANGTKIVILGNAAQIDVPYLNERNNGLSVVASIFTASTLSDEERSLVGFVKLKEGVRSELASLAIKLFAQPLPQR